MSKLVSVTLELQVENPTGHSGRKTFYSVAVNNNVSALVVAQATKRKDPKTLMGYVSVSDNSLMARFFISYVLETFSSKLNVTPCFVKSRFYRPRTGRYPLRMGRYPPTQWEDFFQFPTN